jgi:EAL domain-containing protein (putative c-di-GMP-specific phosphodiesterase class I)
MTVIAEGVETAQQLIGLRSLGCDSAQGFLLSRPMSAEQLEQLVAGA